MVVYVRWLIPTQLYSLLGARQALQFSPHCIDKFELTVHSKQAVKFETNKLYIEGFGENTSSDCLKYYVENISGTDVSEVVTGQRRNAIMTVNGELGKCIAQIMITKAEGIVEVC